MLAIYIHITSPRRQKPFVAINCSSLPRDLMETELFGYDEGAFTGAKKKGNPGKLELGNGGTVFLDEIGEMPVDLQAHLLRVVEDKQIFRIGGTKAKCLDIRFIAASNKNLGLDIIEEGSFRPDLFYRLSVFNIHLPLLRERPEDIAILADHFLRNCNSLNGTTKFFASEVLRLLEEYEWPGNVRELANFVERSFHLSGTSKEINPNHLPAHLISGKIVDRVVNREKGRLVDPSGFPSGGLPRLKEVEESTIMQILSDSRFNMSATARILGIGRSTLYRKLKKYNVVPRL